MKAAMPSFDTKVQLNVGGVRFDTLRSTLLSFEDTMLGRVFGRCDLMLQADPGDGSVFNDRDGEQFGLILDFFRDSASYVAGTVRAASRASKAGDGARAGLFGLFGVALWFEGATFSGTNSRWSLCAAVQSGRRVCLVVVMMVGHDCGAGSGLDGVYKMVVSIVGLVRWRLARHGRRRRCGNQPCGHLGRGGLRDGG